MAEKQVRRYVPIYNVNVRKVMHTWNNRPVRRAVKSIPVTVFSEHTVRQGRLVYTWGRITDKPDEKGQFEYMALRRSDGKTYCQKIDLPAVDPSLEMRVSALEQKTTLLGRRLLDAMSRLDSLEYGK